MSTPATTPITLAEASAHTGLLVALWLEPEAAAALALSGGEPAENLHVTLAYCGDVDELGELAVARAIVAVERETWWRGLLEGKVGGYGRFLASDTSDGQDVFYAAVDVPGLVELRNLVANALLEAGCAPSTTHGYTPHITLSYLEPGAPNPVNSLPATPLLFRAVTVMVGGERRIDVPLASSSWVFAESASLHPARGIGKDGIRFYDSRRPLTFTGASEWVQFLPAPGTYHHVIYGDMELTAEKYARIVANFADGVYGQTLPINCEHDMPASGAVGYIADMRIAADGSIEVKPEWNDRGTALIEGDRFRYVSAEFFESWQDPVTGEWHDDVAFGMAICTNPHFKETVLRPLAASESRPDVNPAEGRGGKSGMSNPTNPEPGAKPAEQRPTITLSEEEVMRLREADRRLTAAEQRAETAEGQVTALTERVSTMERDARKQRFTDLVAGRGGANDGAPWFGDPAGHVATLETLADIAGEDSDEVKRYVEQQNGIAAQLKSSNLFTEIGSSQGSDGDTPNEAQLKAAIAKLREANPNLTHEQAEAQVYSDRPDLFAAAMKGA